jgi:hypothetical protein
MTSPPPGLANTAGSLRQEVAAASSICQIGPTRCQARTRLYWDGKLELEGFPVADISDYLADGSVTIWLDLRGPDRDDLAVLSEEFGLHPLVVEAALRPSQRPKLDRYRSHLLLTAYGAPAGHWHRRADHQRDRGLHHQQGADHGPPGRPSGHRRAGRALGRKPRPRQIRDRLPAVRAAGLHGRWPVRGGPEPG